MAEDNKVICFTLYHLACLSLDSMLLKSFLFCFWRTMAREYIVNITQRSAQTAFHLSLREISLTSKHKKSLKRIFMRRARSLLPQRLWILMKVWYNAINVCLTCSRWNFHLLTFQHCLQDLHWYLNFRCWRIWRKWACS
jgi:hypothetical protein